MHNRRIRVIGPVDEYWPGPWEQETGQPLFDPFGNYNPFGSGGFKLPEPTFQIKSGDEAYFFPDPAMYSDGKWIVRRDEHIYDAAYVTTAVWKALEYHNRDLKAYTESGPTAARFRGASTKVTFEAPSR